MKITEIEAAAAKRFQEISSSHFLKEVKKVVISQYQNMEDYEEIKNKNEPLDFFQYRIYTSCFARLLFLNGKTPIFETIKPNEYFEWLEANDIENDESNRAAFAAMKYNGRNGQDGHNRQNGGDKNE